MAATAGGSLSHHARLTPIDVHGIDVLPLRSYHHAVSVLEARLRAGQRTIVMAANPEKLYRAWTDPAVADLLRAADLRICDGVGLAIVASLLHRRRVTRITGVDLFEALIARAAEVGWRVFLLGATPEVSEAAARRLQERYPDLLIVGRHDGFFASDEEVRSRIEAAAPDMVFVAMGSPRQEQWMVANAPRCRPALWMGIGGTLDVLAGRAPRAPRWVRAAGAEFLYRLVRDPRRWRRQIALPLFVLEAARRTVRARMKRTGAEGDVAA